MKKIVIPKQLKALLIYNRKGYIDIHVEDSKERNKDDWREFTAKMKSFRSCVENLQDRTSEEIFNSIFLPEEKEKILDKSY